MKPCCLHIQLFSFLALNPLYTGGLFQCYKLDKATCHLRDVRSCGIQSGSALFAYGPFTGFQERKGYRVKVNEYTISGSMSAFFFF